MNLSSLEAFWPGSSVVGLGAVVLTTLTVLLLWFVLRRYQVVENNQLMIIESWFVFRKKLSFVSGGSKFILPFFETYITKSLEPMELNIDLHHVMTHGNIPLGGKIFAQVVIDDSEPNVYNIAKHLSFRTREQQMDYCTKILNGIVRETVANLAPEQVLEDKERFKEEMLKNAVVSLSHLGFKIKTLNIQEVGDEIPDGHGYIAQLMRPRMYQVDRDTRIEVSEAESKKVLAQNAANLSMRLMQLDQEMKSLEAEMNYQIEQNIVAGDVKCKEISAELDAKLQEMLASLNTKKAELDTLMTKMEADQIQKAIANQEQLVEEGKSEAVSIVKAGMAEVDVLNESLGIIEKAGPNGLEAFLIDHYQMLSGILTEAMDSTAVKQISVLEGIGGDSKNGGDTHPLSPKNIAVLLEILKTNGVNLDKWGFAPHTAHALSGDASSKLETTLRKNPK